MSHALTSIVWELDIASAQKLVLLELADRVRDDRRDDMAWPSLPTLARRTGLNRRTVIRALEALEGAGLVQINRRQGRGSRYVLRLPPDGQLDRGHGVTGHGTDPCHGVTSDGADPCHGVQDQCHHVTDPCHPVTLTVIEPEESRKGIVVPIMRRAERGDHFPRPAWADAQVWADFLANRKAKRCPNTATAYAAFLRDIERLASPQWPPERLLAHATARGWAGIYEPREANDHVRGSMQSSSTAPIEFGPDLTIERLRRERVSP
ncbi:helix-turn-helix domain-containing protein [Novosphingobium sp.]|uniref:helix-turn-helix domain-containing protein n=1 Tax=Novosphingobium sp. TaxID=1874826 RepID=UPI00262DBA7D|nr:helix-turn-helix domain-containing protein [Novosphingobium sp.]